MAKFIVCEVAPLRGSHLKYEDMRLVAINTDSIDVLHQDIFQVENGDGSIDERVGMELFSSGLKYGKDSRLIIMMDYGKFMKEISNENV